MPRLIRPIRIEGNIAYIPLTKGYEAVIDAADVPLVEGFNWCASVRYGIVYAVRHDNTDPNRNFIRLHRLIAGDQKGLEVDHIDGDGRNNRRENLRLATRAQNGRNRRVSKRNTSGFKSVYWCRRAKKWRASIGLSGKTLYLGSFDTPEAAHAAYCEDSARLHGEFGRPQ